MKLEKSLEKWTTNGLISDEQAKKIITFEHESASASWVLFGISALGIIVLLTGVISIIAANWDEISPFIKLVLYFASLSVLGFATFKRSSTTGVLREVLFIAFTLYVLAGIGLVGQIYHLESDGYSALFFWLIITLPVALLVQSRTVCNSWFLGLAAALVSWCFSSSIEATTALRVFITLSVPYLTLAVGYGFGTVISDHFLSAGRFWSYVTLLIPFAIIGNISWSVGEAPKDLLEYSQLYWYIPTGSVILAVCAVVFRKIQKGQFITASIVMTIFFSWLLTVYPLLTKLSSQEIIGCALFIFAWAGAASIAAANHLKRLFDLSALIIGIRFIVAYFQVFGSLAATGIGLIISGLVILGIAYLWHTYRGTIAIAIQERA
jgi:uncharacterized membrane protein